MDKICPYTCAELDEFQILSKNEIAEEQKSLFEELFWKGYWEDSNDMDEVRDILSEETARDFLNAVLNLDTEVLCKES